MMEHTPTPWTLQRGHPDEIVSADRNFATMFGPITVTKHPDFAAKANAQFIVKAVNNYQPLLDALKDLVAEVDEHDEHVEDLHGPIRDWDNYPLGRARAAVAQAEGSN